MPFDPFTHKQVPYKRPKVQMGGSVTRHGKNIDSEIEAQTKKKSIAKKMFKGLTHEEMKKHSGSVSQFKRDFRSGEAKGQIGKKKFGYYNQQYNA